MLSIVFGFSIIMSSFYSFLILVIPVFVAAVYRIRVEEMVLINEFGDSYLEYKSRTKKLVPGIY
jgi:protein-S-isoprenylcysteine O-methyltransferase Ste14